MGDDVAVRVADEPAVARKPYAREHERHPVGERVGVDADTDSDLAAHAEAPDPASQALILCCITRERNRGSLAVKGGE